MRIAVDVMGGDHGCAVVIEGARLALQACPDLTEVLLVGNEQEIQAEVDRSPDARLVVVHAAEVLTMSESPVAGLRSKKDTSIARAVELLQEAKADALVSPGNTGSVVTAAALALRRVEGVTRPAIATVMPSGEGRFVLVDAGANVDCRPEHLLHFGVMGSVYAREILARPEPRVGLLNVGTEDSKGSKMVHDAFKLLRQSGLKFVGNVESHDIFAGRVDVVVCDGFTGNVFLKTCESLAHTLIKKVGAYLPREVLAALDGQLNPDNFGGAPLLGVNGNVMIAHGASRQRAIANAIRTAADTVRHDLFHAICAEVARVNSVTLPQR